MDQKTKKTYECHVPVHGWLVLTVTAENELDAIDKAVDAFVNTKFGPLTCVTRGDVRIKETE